MCNDLFCRYFDSYGTGVPQEVSRALGVPEEAVVHPHKQVQHDNSRYCGDFALAAAHKVAEQPNRAPDQAIKSLFQNLSSSKLKSNDKHIEDILKSASGKGRRTPFYFQVKFRK